jgi:hypothetical protein
MRTRTWLVACVVAFLAPAPARAGWSDEACIEAYARLKPLMQQFGALEKAKAPTALETPPRWECLCRGEPGYEARDKKQDEEKDRFVESTFLGADAALIRSISKLLGETARGGCAPRTADEQTGRVYPRLAGYLVTRLRQAATQALAVPSTAGHDTFRPLIEAIVARYKDVERIDRQFDSARELETYVLPLERAYVQELVRRVAAEHEFRILPRHLVDAIQRARLVGPSSPRSRTPPP